MTNIYVQKMVRYHKLDHLQKKHMTKTIGKGNKAWHFC